ncbi:Neuropeptide-like protein C4orf48 -like [Scophthalmus maximus]|uniref:NELL2-interacting cell ontogeny regulator 1 n=1 Tax=Scophthalmus maximus TaxID=52904 RepID=A0A2U9B0V0_SCOMX|nr:Neuropeptide-like protein C4orf48 -like [Scophthalmus maximus]
MRAALTYIKRSEALVLLRLCKHHRLIGGRSDQTLAMASSGFVQAAALLLAAQLLWLGAADQEPGTVIPAESRPCVDCHAFEFMQRALQDLKKTAFNLDARTETLVLRAERRALCDCMPTNSLR